jgi:hypothetical protein
MLVEGRGFELQVWNRRREGNKICRGEREREREKDWVFFSDKFGRFWVECFGHFEDWFLLGGLRIGLGFPEA